MTMGSLLENTQKLSSIPHSADQSLSATMIRKKQQKLEEQEIEEVREALATKSDQAMEKSLLKNAEFNLSVRRQFNRYKRQMRERLLFQKQESEGGNNYPVGADA